MSAFNSFERRLPRTLSTRPSSLYTHITSDGKHSLCGISSLHCNRLLSCPSPRCLLRGHPRDSSSELNLLCVEHRSCHQVYHWENYFQPNIPMSHEHQCAISINRFASFDSKGLGCCFTRFTYCRFSSWTTIYLMTKPYAWILKCMWMTPHVHFSQGKFRLSA